MVVKVLCSRLQYVIVGCNTSLAKKGSAALDELQVMLSRAVRRRQAHATAEAGRLARQNWRVYRA
jgi:hypothetical protein